MYGYGLFSPGTLTQVISVVGFLLIMSGFTIGGLKLYWKQHQINSLQTQLTECTITQEQLEHNNSFLRDNLKQLKDYYEYKRPPVINKEGQLILENLFNAEPR